jgi:predicted Zn finger-like uncharacterized protein
MLITCPTCAAVYRVGDDAIGPDGRNVQCDACGAQWRQAPEAKARASGPAEDEVVRAESWAEEDIEEDLAEDLGADPDEAAEEAAGAVRPKTPGLEEAAELLQEMREESARASSIDIFGDGAEASGRTEAAPPEKRKRDRDESEITTAQIKATIASANKSSPNAAKPQGGGFRVGFILALMVVAGLAFAYLAKDLLANQFPAAASALDTYAGLVDMVRVQVENAAAEAMKEDAPATQ